MSDSAIETMLASEAVLAKDWSTPEEDAAWESLSDEALSNFEASLDTDIELNSPNWCGEIISQLKARGFKRINSPRRGIVVKEKHGTFRHLH